MKDNEITHFDTAEKRLATNIRESDPNADINLILDNSLQQYAGEAFIIEHAKKVNRKFAVNRHQE